MTNKLGSILVRIAKVFHASNRGRNLERHADLAHQFALVAQLGGGAIVTFQALHLPESDDSSLIGAPPRRGQSPRGWAVSPQP